MPQGPYTYDYPRPMMTTDAVVFAVRDGGLDVLLIQRKSEPFAGRWALPGGFLDMEETLEASVVRELQEETGLSGIRLEQFHTFSDPRRDPRGRSLSTAFLALVDPDRHTPRAADDAGDAAWRNADEAHGLAFDHDRIVTLARERLRLRARCAGVGAQVLPEKFTLDALRRVYEAVLGEGLEPEAFAARVVERGIVASEPDGLYRFAPGPFEPI